MATVVSQSLPHDASPVDMTIRLLMIQKEVRLTSAIWEHAEIPLIMANDYYPERVVTLNGPSHHIVYRIKAILKELERDTERGHALTVLFSSNQCVVILGQRNKTKKDLEENSGASIVFANWLPNSDERSVTISGTSDAITKCMGQICILISRRSKCTRPYRVYFPYDQQLFVPPKRVSISQLMTEHEIESVIGKGVSRCEMIERFRQESGTLVDVYISNRGHQLNPHTPMSIFNVSGTPDELVMAFKYISTKFEKDFPSTSLRDSTVTKLRLLLSAPRWRLLEANAQAKARNIAKYTGVGMYIPQRPIQTLQKMVNLTGTSESLIKAIYHICGIHLESLRDGGRCFQGVVPIDNSIPTLKDFPYPANTCERTLQWARDMFQALFRRSLESAAEYLSNKNFVRRILRMEGSQALEILEAAHRCLIEERPENYEECVRWARLQWDKLYQNPIKQLLIHFPPDQLLKTGQSFWSEHKRCPHPLEFDIENPNHVDFVMAASNLMAKIYNIPSEIRDREAITKMLCPVPESISRSRVEISVQGNEVLAVIKKSVDDQINDIKTKLASVDSFSGLRISPMDFNKDVDISLYMDFIAASSKLRAENYGITSSDRLKDQIFDGELFGFAEPIAAPKQSYYNKQWTLWDRFEVLGKTTVLEFLTYFDREHELKVTKISKGADILYAVSVSPSKSNEGMDLSLTEVVERISKKKLEPDVKALVLELCCINIDKESVKIPYVLYVLPTE